MTAVVTLTAVGAEISPSVRRYRTEAAARDGYTGYDLKDAHREAQRLGRAVTMELWLRWDQGMHTQRIAVKEVDPEC